MYTHKKYSHTSALQDTEQTTKRYNTLQEKLKSKDAQIDRLQQLISVIKPGHYNNEQC